MARSISLSRWLAFLRPTRKHGRQKRPQPPGRILVVESLEGRCVPSTVTNLQDAGAGSLRQALRDTPAGGTVDFQPGLTGTITLTSGELKISRNLTIAGPGADAITVSGNQTSRVFDISSGTVRISGLTIADGNDRTFGGGILNEGTLSLADAIVRKNAAPAGAGIISFGPLTVTHCTISKNTAGRNNQGGGIDLNSFTDAATITDTVISDNFAGDGAGISSAGNLTVTHCTIKDNSTPANGFGGGIASGGALTITDSIVRDNSAGESAGIDSFGTLTVTHCTIIGNSTTNKSIGSGFGGGISAGFNTATITDTLVSGNVASIGAGIISFGMTTLDRSTVSGNAAINGKLPVGGGIEIDGGTMTILNSTISGNKTLGDGDGGGIFNYGTLNLMSSTLSNNSADSGGGLYNLMVSPTVQNTILAGNTATASPDVFGSLDSQGHNLIGDGTGGSGYADTDLVGIAENPIDPRLGPLQDNGGPTPTQALLVGSPAIDAGDNTDAPPTDQRGAPRIFHDTIDIGAYEVQAAPRPHAAVAQSFLWPPDQRLVNVGLDVQLNADADPSTHLQVQVYADDQAGAGDAGDIGPGTLQLRATRHNALLGRVYLIVTSATDASGRVAMSVTTVVVPGHHDPLSIGLVRLEAALARGWVDLFHATPPGFRLLGEGPGDGSAAPPWRQSETSTGIHNAFRLAAPVQPTPLLSSNEEMPWDLVEAITRTDGFPPGSWVLQPAPGWSDAVTDMVLDVIVSTGRLPV